MIKILFKANKQVNIPNYFIILLQIPLFLKNFKVSFKIFKSIIKVFENFFNPTKKLTLCIDRPIARQLKHRVDSSRTHKFFLLYLDRICIDHKTNLLDDGKLVSGVPET